MSILKESEELLGKSDDTYNSSFLGADLELDNTSEKEILLYRHNEVILTVEHGVSLGLLKLIYSTDPRLEGSLQGVRSRPSMDDESSISTVILSDDRVLNEDEYELIVRDDVTLSQPPMVSSPCSSTHQTTPVSLSEQIIYSDKTHESATCTIATSSQTIFGKTKKTQELVCEYCHLPFISKAKYLRHRRIHTEEKPYACVYCTETFAYHIELRNHREEKHMRDKTFKCNFCPKSFSTRAELQGHTWRHTGQKNHKCRICSKMFATKGNLKLHIDKHIGARKHKCPFCVQRFTSHSSLEGHMAKHTGMKSYKCRYCPKSFGQSGQLTSHERLHTGEKPFVCKTCGKGFRLNSTRLAHEKRHSGSRPHICDTCGRSFSMPEHLKRHMKSHENRLDRLVSCPFCKKSIFAGRNMKKHLIRHKELGITEIQAKSISATLKPDREMNERDFQSGHGGKQTKQSLNCCECNLEFKTMRKLLEHIAIAHYRRELTANEKKELRMRHGAQKFHHCQFCTSYFLDYRLFKSHLATEHSEYLGLVNIRSMRKMMMISDSLYKCPTCAMCFRLRSSLNDHILKKHLPPNPVTSTCSDVPPLHFRCWYCPQQFENPEGVVSHMTTAHESLDVLSKRVETTDWLSDNNVSSSGLWTCPHCPVTMKSEQEYTEHLASVHYPLSSEVLAEATTNDELKTGGECVIEKYLNVKKVLKSASDRQTDYSSDDAIDMNLSAEIVPHKQQLENSKTADSESISYNPTQSTTAKSNLESLSFHRSESGHSRHVSSTLVQHTSEENTPKFNSLLHTVSAPAHNNISKYIGHHTELPPDVSLAFNRNQINTENENRDKNQQECGREGGVFQDNILVNDSSGRPPQHLNGTSKSADTDKISDETDDVTTGNAKLSNANMLKKNTFPNSRVSEINSQVVMQGNASGDIHIYEERKRAISLKTRRKFGETETHKVERSGKSTDLTRKKKKSKKKKHKKKRSSQDDKTKEPFHCWFCDVTFSCPEDAVSHMTNEHDNLEGLSRRVETTQPRLSNLELIEPEVNQHAHVDDTNNVAPFEEIYKTREVSLSPMQDFKCSLCPRKLDSKEAFELHMMVHGASDNHVTSHRSISPSLGDESTHLHINIAESINRSKVLGKPSPKPQTSNDYIGLSPSVSRCLHCSRVFCGKKALDTHIYKMHGKEYSSKATTDTSSPFSCWFCNASFTSPESVVEHMTNSHENLDNLSKRVEENTPATFNSILGNSTSSKTSVTTVVNSSVLKDEQLKRSSTQKPSITSKVNHSPGHRPAEPGNHQPPPGFKVSYALAYVPIFVPEKSVVDEESS